MNELTLFSYFVYFISAGIFLSLASYLDTLVMRENGMTDNAQLRSACDNCGRQLRWYELLPIVSFLILRGRCSSCKSKIDIRIFLAEVIGLVTGLLFAARALQVIFASASTPIKILTVVIEASVFLVLMYVAIYDLFTFSMPTWVLNVLGFVAVGINVLWLVMTQYGAWETPSFASYGSVGNLAVGILSGLLFGLVIVITKERGLGMGDLYLAAFLGLLLGWPNIISALYVMLGTSLTAGLIYCFKIRKFKGVILPLVPFIALGYMISISFGQQIFQLLFPFV